MDSLIFYILHHSSSDLHTYILDQCLKSIRQFHENKIIVCKTSTSIIPDHMLYQNVEYVNTPVDGSHVYGILQTMVENENFQNFILMQDGMILLKKLPDQILTKKFYFLWHFDIALDDHFLNVISLVVNSKLTERQIYLAIEKYMTKDFPDWKGLFGPGFGGNYESLKLFWNALNVKKDALETYIGKDMAMSTERSFSLVANVLGLIDQFENSYSLNGSIENHPNAFHRCDSIEGIDDSIAEGSNSYDSYMLKIWVSRLVVPKQIPKVAICLRGAISKTSQRFVNPGSLYNQGEYVNYVSVYNSIKKHIIDANPDATFDFFIQSWNVDLKDKLIELYKPKKYLFENNDLYKDEIVNNLNHTNKPLTDFATSSQMLAIKKSINIMKNYVEKSKYTDADFVEYNKVILYRPDVLLFKDMIMDSYLPDKIYVNAHPNSGGDFHFVMNLKNSYEFSQLYETTKTNNCVTDHPLHGKIKMYVEHYMNKHLVMDNIIPGVNQEVLRQLKLCSIDKNNIPIDFFYQYGLTEEEILSYCVH